MDKFNNIILQMHSLVIFRNLLDCKVIHKFLCLLESMPKNTAAQVSQYACFASELFKSNNNLTKYIRDCVLKDENIYIRKIAANEEVDSEIEKCLRRELNILEELSRIEAPEITQHINYNGYLPVWKTSNINLNVEYYTRAEKISRHGYGIYSESHMFTFRDGIITPVKHPDTTNLHCLKGYEDERQSVIDNTLVLLKGGPATNVLLYGDAGTGKSSTVKAVANEFKDRGLRIIEIRKNQLESIPAIREEIEDNCLKFILFIDDLSFTKNSDEFGILKAILEGSITANPVNSVIYATSNRRHLIKESFSDRNGDDIHVNETIQELASLSERFGLTVCFSRPDKCRYLDIVKELAKDYKIDIDPETLEQSAERYALLRGGRSPRIAKQLIENIVGQKEYLFQE